MCYSSGIAFSNDVAIFLTVLLSCVIICCLLTNIRLAWLGARGSSVSNQSINLSPFLLSCCCSDTALVCIFGPVLCIIISQDNWVLNDSLCAFLDCLFLALFWSTTISLLLYSLDRHCLLVERRLYLNTFGKHKRNIKTLVAVWIIPAVSSLPYLKIRTLLAAKQTPMIFLLTENMLYCVFAIVILYMLPILITLISVTKTLFCIKRKSKNFHNNENARVHRSLPGILREDFQTHKGLMGSSCIYILTSIPWVIYQLVKALGLNSNMSLLQETVLITILIMGVGLKTVTYVVCCGFIRRLFFANMFRNNSFDFTLEPPPVVVINTAAV